MTAQHTPGPWTASDNAIYGSSSLIKPLIAYLDDRFADEEAANNARLIAAAPDLLAALQMVNRVWSHDQTANLAPDSSAAIVRAAIAKAVG
jgi:hypothetical protein